MPQISFHRLCKRWTLQGFVYTVTNMTISPRKPHPHLNLPRVGSISHIQSMISPTSVMWLLQFTYPPTSQENEPEIYLPKMTLNCSPNMNTRPPAHLGLWVHFEPTPLAIERKATTQSIRVCNKYIKVGHVETNTPPKPTTMSFAISLPST